MYISESGEIWQSLNQAISEISRTSALGREKTRHVAYLVCPEKVEKRN